jgi:transposase InsO family protein
MYFPIRKIGMLEMPKIAMLSTVSRCGFYKYQHRDSKKLQEDDVIGQAISKLQEEHHDSIGYRHMVTLLEKDTGKKLGSRRIRRIMKEKELQSAVRRKKYSDEVYIRRRKMKESLPPDLIQRHFYALEPYKRMVEDITYLPCIEQTYYLNAIADLYNGEILAYTISDSVDTKLCTDTVKALMNRIKCIAGAVLHSDGGSTYQSYAYRSLLEALGIRMSLGKTGICYDNAAMSCEILIYAKEWPETVTEGFILGQYFA